MSVVARNNVNVQGRGRPMVFVHGFGCNQTMWRLLAPHFAARHQVILLDLVGSGDSDWSAYDRNRHGTLQGHADDVCEVLREVAREPAIFVGHSVGAMIGLLASLRQPELIAAQVMLGPSPSYLNDGDYYGGFNRDQLEGLLASLDANYLGWAGEIAPVIMGAPDRPELARELAASFRRADPAIAKHFARVTFTADHRDDLPRLQAPTLILQCSDDVIAPLNVGEYMYQAIPNSQLRVIENVGHCPHLSAASASARVVEGFLEGV